ncbi:hypothetical protein [Microbacterium rhizomatis]|uniref:Uncharacterized protein n=1 Tax=Microbacterium rhizomatis TaxID=1631477 RepID=A0A5J5J1W0_9MICO|nr:hypothetical protein [Microbacterium rhizomatis]KAA9110167.1 hypothetical protein F6B43_00195 [Microbacterium rhizomatis]
MSQWRRRGSRGSIRNDRASSDEDEHAHYYDDPRDKEGGRADEFHTATLGDECIKHLNGLVVDKVTGRENDPMTTDDKARLVDEYAQLSSELEVLDAVIAERDAAQAKAKAIARAIGHHLARIGHFAELAEERFDNDLARRLYWGYPDIHVAEIARPMRLREALVNNEVGNGTFEKPCAGECGATVTWNMKNRTDSRRQPRLCADCKAEAERQAEIERARWQAESNAEHAEDLERLKAAVDREPYARYAEFRGVPGTWRVDEHGIPYALRGPDHD